MKRDTLVKWGSLGILTYMYVVGELSHFLLGIVSRPMSQELHYGDEACLPNPESPHQSQECRTITNTSRCEEYNNGTECVWDYSGLGLEYQILAGPAFIFVFTTAGVFISILADRLNRKVVVTVCCGVLTLATGLTGAAMSYWQLVILRMAMGAGESAFTPVSSSCISDLFSESRRALALGIFNWGIYFGYGLSYAVGNFVTAADIAGMGWRWSYIITGLMGVVAILLLVIMPEPSRHVVQTRTDEMGKIYTIPENSQRTATALSDAENSDVKEGDSKTAEASLPFSDSKEGLIASQSGFKQVVRALVKPPILMLTLAAGLRHTAGFSWSYNTQLYFQTYYPEVNLGLWITGASIIGGSLGVAVGGLVSDKLVKRIGLRARLYVLSASQMIATPFAVGVLYFAPPAAFFSLLGAYLFAEMWFGVLFAVLLELVPNSIKSTAIAIFLFVMNNIGGNLPVLVDKLSQLLSYREALLIMYPGGYLASSVLFFLTSFTL